MIATALALIVLGVVFGFFFPVVFVAAAAGGILLLLGLIASARRAKVEAHESSEPS